MSESMSLRKQLELLSSFEQIEEIISQLILSSSFKCIFPFENDHRIVVKIDKQNLNYIKSDEEEKKDGKK